MGDLEEFFREQIKPYEERLKRLEDLDKKKDVEIHLLKLAIEQMRSEIDKLRTLLATNKVGAATGATSKPGTATKKVEPKGKDVIKK
jgi:hypothetical protein